MARALRRAAVAALVRLLMGAATLLTMLTVWVDRALRPRLPFPRDPDELRARRAWCVERLQAAGALPQGAEITSFEVQGFKRAEAFRSRVATVRVGWRAAGQGGTLDLLAKFAPAPTNLRDHALFVLQRNHVKETAVYRDLAGDPSVAAPRTYFAACHERTGNLCILMERMTPAQEVGEADGCPADLAPVVMDAFAALHARHWGGDDPAASSLAVVPDALIDTFATFFRGPDRALFGALLRKVWRHDGRAPVTVLHGDARVGNMLFPTGGGRGRFVLIDWQAARKGRGAFDVAYFLTLSLAPDVRRAHEAALLDRYHQGLVAAGVEGYSREALADDYRNAVLLVLAFVSLPFLSAESSDNDANKAGLRELGDVWTERMRAAVDDLDLPWVSARYDLDAQALAAAFARSNAPRPA